MSLAELQRCYPPRGDDGDDARSNFNLGDGDLRIASYDPSSRTIIYESANALVVNAETTQVLVEFTQAAVAANAGGRWGGTLGPNDGDNCAARSSATKKAAAAATTTTSASSSSFVLSGSLLHAPMPGGQTAVHSASSSSFASASSSFGSVSLVVTPGHNMYARRCSAPSSMAHVNRQHGGAAAAAVGGAAAAPALSDNNSSSSSSPCADRLPSTSHSSSVECSRSGGALKSHRPIARRAEAAGGFTKVRAAELLALRDSSADDSSSIASSSSITGPVGGGAGTGEFTFLGFAEGGVGVYPSRAGDNHARGRALTPVSALHLDTPTKLNAFLMLAGCWLGDGSNSSTISDTLHPHCSSSSINSESDSSDTLHPHCSTISDPNAPTISSRVVGRCGTCNFNFSSGDGACALDKQHGCDVASATPAVVVFSTSRVNDDIAVCEALGELGLIEGIHFTRRRSSSSSSDCDSASPPVAAPFGADFLPATAASAAGPFSVEGASPAALFGADFVPAAAAASPAALGIEGLSALRYVTAVTDAAWCGMFYRECRRGAATSAATTGVEPSFPSCQLQPVTVAEAGGVSQRSSSSSRVDSSSLPVPTACVLTQRLPAWAWQLSRDEARTFLLGLCTHSAGADSVLTTSTRFRDDVVRLVLHAGYAPNFNLEQKQLQQPSRAPGAPNFNLEQQQQPSHAPAAVCAPSGIHPISNSSSSSGSSTWRVSFSSLVEHTSPTLRPHSGDVRTVQHTGRTWCVSVPHGLVWARRVVRDASGAVVASSRPVLTGNCDLKPENILFRVPVSERACVSVSVCVCVWLCLARVGEEGALQLHSGSYSYTCCGSLCGRSLASPPSSVILL